MRWRALLDRARTAALTDKDKQEMYLLAANWDTCAIGEYRTQLTGARYRFHVANGSPRAMHLDDLGMQFYTSIKEEQWEEASRVLGKIEALAGVRRGSTI